MAPSRGLGDCETITVGATVGDLNLSGQRLTHGARPCVLAYFVARNLSETAEPHGGFQADKRPACSGVGNRLRRHFLRHCVLIRLPHLGPPCAFACSLPRTRDNGRGGICDYCPHPDAIATSTSGDCARM